MDSTMEKHPILSCFSHQLRPYTHPPPLLRWTQHNLIFNNPKKVLSTTLSQSIPNSISQTQLDFLFLVDRRPDRDVVSSARLKIAQTEQIGLTSDQVKKKEREKEICEEVLRLNDLYEEELADLEKRLGFVDRDLDKDGVYDRLKVAESGGAVEGAEFSERRLRCIPEGFGNLRLLVSLNLSHNELEFLPDSVAGLQKLEELDISSNRLQTLPESIALLLHLRVLNVSGNHLNSLPESFTRCSSLVEFDASFNNLTYLPNNIGCGLMNLEKLSIQMNKIRFLPLSICQTRSLRFVDAHFNELHGLPQSIGRLTNLEILNVSSNFGDLTDLPETIGDLVNLQELDLSYNQLRALPDTFGALKKLTKLNLDQNPLVIPPIVVANKGPEAVREFMVNKWAGDVAGEGGGKRMSRVKTEEYDIGWMTWGTTLLNRFVSGV